MEKTNSATNILLIVVHLKVCDNLLLIIRLKIIFRFIINPLPL